MGTGEALHGPFVGGVLIYSPVAEVNITLGGLSEQWLSDTADTHTV